MKDGFDIAGVVKSFAEIPSILKKAETFCGELSHEFLKQKSGNFERVASNYTADGLLVTYKCARDNRLYDIHIVARRD